MTDEGGTTQYAYWNFGLTDFTKLLEDTVPSCGVYLIDLDKDLIYYFDAKTYEWLWRSHESVENAGGLNCVFMMMDPATVITEICSVKTWSEWSANLDNLKGMRDSLATVFGLDGDEPIADVQPLLSSMLRTNVARLACPVEAADLTADEAPVHSARCLKLPKRARYVPKETGSFNAKLG